MGYKLGHSREKVEKASKGLGKASTSLFSKKGNSNAKPPKIHVNNKLK